MPFRAGASSRSVRTQNQTKDVRSIYPKGPGPGGWFPVQRIGCGITQPFWKYLYILPCRRAAGKGAIDHSTALSIFNGGTEGGITGGAGKVRRIRQLRIASQIFQNLSHPSLQGAAPSLKAAVLLNGKTRRFNLDSLQHRTDPLMLIDQVRGVIVECSRKG